MSVLWGQAPRALVVSWFLDEFASWRRSPPAQSRLFHPTQGGRRLAHELPMRRGDLP